MFYQKLIAEQTGRPNANRQAASDGQYDREREHQRVREAILDAAEQLLLAEGYDGLSMRRVGARCGYAASTLYSYFRGKQEILTAVIERTSDYLVEALDDAARTPGPLTRLRMLGRAYVEFGLQHPQHYEVLFLRREATAPVIETPTFGLAVAYFQQAVVDGVKNGNFRRCNPEETAQAFWAACHGLVALLIHQADRFLFADANRLLENLLTMQIEGLRPAAFGFSAAGRERQQPKPEPVAEVELVPDNVTRLKPDLSRFAPDGSGADDEFGLLSSEA